MSSAQRKKQEIRKTVLKQRKAVPEAQRYQYSKNIHQHLIQWNHFQKAKRIHTFVSLPDEPDTFSILETCWQLGKKTIVPYVLSHSGFLGHTVITSSSQLVKDVYNIWEPKHEYRDSIEPIDLDLIFVPGVAFDKMGNRLGFGKGFYDQFLSQTSGFRLGIAFEFQILHQIPFETHDIKMDALLTEKGFIHCSQIH